MKILLRCELFTNPKGLVIKLEKVQRLYALGERIN